MYPFSSTVISFFFQGRPVWSQVGLSESVFLKPSFSIPWIVTFVESFWNLSDFKETGETCLAGVVSQAVSALCLCCWALTQQSEEPVGCAHTRAQLGWGQAAVNCQKHPWPVSWAWCSLSLTSGNTSSGSAVSRGEAACMWATTHESQRRSLLPGPFPPSPFLLCVALFPPSTGAVGSRPLSTLWEAAANGPPLPECDQKLSTHIFFQLAWEAAVSGERWCWQLGLLAIAQGTIQAGSVLNVPLRLHSLTCSCPFPADTGNCPAQVVLIQDYGAGMLAWVCETLLGFFPF